MPGSQRDECGSAHTVALYDWTGSEAGSSLLSLKRDDHMEGSFITLNFLTWNSQWSLTQVWKHLADCQEQWGSYPLDTGRSYGEIAKICLGWEWSLPSAEHYKDINREWLLYQLLFLDLGQKCAACCPMPLTQPLLSRASSKTQSGFCWWAPCPKNIITQQEHPSQPPTDISQVVIAICLPN